MGTGAGICCEANASGVVVGGGVHPDGQESKRLQDVRVYHFRHAGTPKFVITANGMFDTILTTVPKPRGHFRDESYSKDNRKTASNIQKK